MFAGGAAQAQARAVRRLGVDSERAPRRVCQHLVDAPNGVALLAEEDIFGQRSSQAARPIRADLPFVIAFRNLKDGDLVVHVDYGIGRYAGLPRTLHLSMSGMRDMSIIATPPPALEGSLPADAGDEADGDDRSEDGQEVAGRARRQQAGAAGSLEVPHRAVSQGRGDRAEAAALGSAAAAVVGRALVDVSTLITLPLETGAARGR